MRRAPGIRIYKSRDPHIGMSGTNEAQQQLASIYSACQTNPAVKKEIIRSLMVSHGRDALFNLAKSEKDPELRAGRSASWADARRGQLAHSTHPNRQPETDPDRTAVSSCGHSDKLLELSKSKKDENVAVRSSAASRSRIPPRSISSSICTPRIRPSKKATHRRLFSRGDAKAMVDLRARSPDPVMKKRIVERLS